MTALRKWQTALEAWAIPAEILEQAKGGSPWQLDPKLFTAAPSADLGRGAAQLLGRATERALDALPSGGIVLDIGCGGGAASLALTPTAGTLVGIDESSAMLEHFAAAARSRGIAHKTVLGRWPDVQDQVGVADVAVCHHVFYNVSNLSDFALAMSNAARSRVVVELTPRHPQTRNHAVWQHFWGVTRPPGPTSADALDVLLELGIEANLEHDTQVNSQRVQATALERAAQVARMCCLGPDQVDEVAAFLADHPPERKPPDVIWWDVA